jgi:tubulin monoglycylase TTLL3/8
VETPALYKQRKFDIRCFCLVTSTNGHLKAFNYDSGYLRTCGREYNLKTFNKFIHLTNDAVQKKSEDYGRHEFGNKVSFEEY